MHGQQNFKFTYFVFVALISQQEKSCTVLYCHVWPLWLYDILPHYLMNDTVFGKNVLNINVYADFRCNIWLKYFSI